MIIRNMHSSGAVSTKPDWVARFAVLVLYISAFGLLRQHAFAMGFPVPVRLIGQVSAILGVVSVAIGMGFLFWNSDYRRLIHPRAWKLWWIWCAAILFYGLVGAFIGNEIALIVKEATALLAFSLFWATAANNSAWDALVRHCFIICLAAVPLLLFTLNVPAVEITEFDVASLDRVASNRYLDSLAYGSRALVEPAVLLGAIALIGVGPRWKLLLYAVIWLSVIALNVLMFKFRGYVVGALIVMICAIGIPFFVSRRLNWKAIAGLSVVVVVGFYVLQEAENFGLLMRRFTDEPIREGIFDSRINELEAYGKDLGWYAVLGRGIGGTFDASLAIGTSSAARWPVLHIGILTFTLKGGVFLLVVFAAFSLWPALWSKPRAWFYQHRNLVALVLLPSIVYRLFMAPLALNQDSLTQWCVFGLVLGRFSSRLVSASLNCPAIYNPIYLRGPRV